MIEPFSWCVYVHILYKMYITRRICTSTRRVCVSVSAYATHALYTTISEYFLLLLLLFLVSLWFGAGLVHHHYIDDTYRVFALAPNSADFGYLCFWCPQLCVCVCMCWFVHYVHDVLCIIMGRLSHHSYDARRRQKRPKKSRKERNKERKNCTTALWQYQVLYDLMPLVDDK